MNETEYVKVEMAKAYECKHSVRYNARTDEDKTYLTSIYISKACYADLGQPDLIVIRIQKP